MGRIRIDYRAVDQTALLTGADGCQEGQWAAVRRFWEEKFPSLATNEGVMSLSLPWWAFLSCREIFRYILASSSIAGVDITVTARDLLIASRERDNEYKQASQGVQPSPEDMQLRLSSLGFTRHLLPYQTRNVSRLCTLGAGASFSVPGSGKTTEALAYYFLTRAENDRLLVIAPKNAFVAWEDELPACVPSIGFHFRRLTGGAQHIRQLLLENPPAIIISYHQLPHVMSELCAYLARNRSYIFVDESHRMKRGAGGVHGSCLLNLAHLAKRKLLLSGTPVPNSPGDLVPQFGFLYPEIPTQPDDVAGKFRPVFVRTTKSELGLRPPQYVSQKVPMGPAQERLYRALASDAARHIEGLSVRDRLRFRAFSRCVQYMLQASSNPALLLDGELAPHDLVEAAVSEGISQKIEFACSLARKWIHEDGQKVVIWSTFVKTVEHVSGLLSDVGAEFIHGGVGVSEEDDAEDSREAKIRSFNSPSSSCKVLVANPAACSEGISLHHVCHRAIYIDRNYNAAQYLQSVDRIHRIGLASDVRTVIAVLSSPGSIDESVARRLELKVATMGAILDDPGLSIRSLDLDSDDDQSGLDADDVEDLRRMLRL